MSLRLILSVLFALHFMLPAPAGADVLIENVTLIDGTGRPAVEGASVLVEGDRITRSRGEPSRRRAGRTASTALANT
jgi:hypothetical protein